MLNIINDLECFFEDCYRRINVREYARIKGISPPTASKILTNYQKEGLLLKEEYRNFLFYYANKDGKIFIDISRIFWDYKLKELTDFLEEKLTNPSIILFGSLSKGEVKEDSDIDLAIFAHKKEINLEKFEKRLKRKVQILWIEDIKSKELAINIINAYILKGRINLNGLGGLLQKKDS